MGEIENRELSSDFIDLWKKDGWHDFFNCKDELFLGIRHDYVNLYYRGYNLCKVELKGQKNKKYLYATTHKKYCGERVLNKNDTYRKIELEELKDKYQSIVEAMRRAHNTDLERMAEQKLIHLNNRNLETDWFCVDMEYVQSRASKKEEAFGRADILAVSRNHPGKTILIELKYGKKAIRDGIKKDGKRYSGVCKHMEDFYKLLNSVEPRKLIWEDICAIIRSYQQLNDDPSFLSNYCKVDYDQATFQPYFITLDSRLGNQDHDAQKYMQKFLLGVEDCDPDFNFQKNFHIDVTDKFGGFYTKFLFSNRDIFNVDGIDRILDPEQYDSNELK